MTGTGAHRARAGAEKCAHGPADPRFSRYDDATEGELGNAREVAAWGTHQAPGECLAVISFVPFTQVELADNGVKSTIEAGHLALTGELYVGAWHSFTYGCDYGHGEIACPRVTLPAGVYRVTVHRPFRADEERESLENTRFLIHLERIGDGQVCDPLTQVPGADGWL